MAAEAGARGHSCLQFVASIIPWKMDSMDCTLQTAVVGISWHYS